ncbi:alanine dehydrogenase [Nitrospirillum iridis]|uniref:Alanine dehydrogenase n=1 Tax=Nitrospirillum iridis TaxID=765888 RepID=A0A7X0B2K5_9PROT|nr:alanine dehydrogenase [Nitrospirillum iridis]MBB6254584.1 alanine dehydrogenase [Nitrospirillum iridis]
MLVGVPKEIKNHEYRVGLIPANVRQLVAHGHSVVVQKNAGAAIGLTDDQYAAAGAALVDTAEEVFAKADMIVKVKEPQPHECRMLRPGQVLFTYLHLAPDPEQTELLLASGAICIAYETVTDARGGLPLLAPMSEVAGRMSIQAGAKCLEKSYGGNGILLGGVPGTPAAKVVVIGGGVVGLNAARMAVGLEAEVTVLDKSLDRLRQIDQQYGRRVNTLYANLDTVEKCVLDADLVIGAVLVPGANAPKVVTKEMVTKMRPGSVLVDVSIDQGGCFETSHATTHADPTYVVDGVIHYCVANMPGAVARTSTFALNNATAPFVLALADKGWQQALADDVHLRNGLNVFRGKLTHPALVEAGDARYVAAETAIA